MPILILSSTGTGRTHLAHELAKHVHVVDLDSVIASLLIHHKLQDENLPIIGPPHWLAQIHIEALQSIPNDADIYIGSQSFIPPFLNPAFTKTIFLRIDDLPSAYRRYFFYILKQVATPNTTTDMFSDLDSLPVTGLKFIFESILGTMIPIVHYENFVRNYDRLGLGLTKLSADELVDFVEGMVGYKN